MSQTSEGRPVARPNRTTPGSSEVSISAGGAVNANGANIAGRDVNNTSVQKTRNLRFSLGGLAIVVLSLAGYGIHQALTSSSVVNTAGVAGATGTLQQLQQAEQNNDPSSWCFLASSSDSATCRSLLGEAWETGGSQSDRSQIGQIGIGAASGSGETYTFNLQYRGHSYGVEMQWTGERWELLPEMYDFAIMDGGIFTAVIETSAGQGAILGMPFSAPTSAG